MKPRRGRSHSVNPPELKSPTISTGKRKQSPENQTVPAEAPKKSRTSNMSSKDFDELKSLITGIGSKIDDSQNRMEHNFANLASKVNEQISSLTSSMGEFQEKTTSEIDEMQLKIMNHTHHMENTDDDIKRLQLSHDLRLTGIPATVNEKLIDIFNKIAIEIGFQTDAGSTLPSLERIPIKNKTTGQFTPSNIIIIHFTTQRQKQMFYSLYLNQMPLDNNKFDLPADKPIRVGENLTKKNANLFRDALLAKRNNKIAQVFTEDGLVKLRFKKGKKETSYTVRNNIELETMIAQQATETQTNTTSNITLNRVHEQPSNNSTAVVVSNTHSHTGQTTTSNYNNAEVTPMETNEQRKATDKDTNTQHNDKHG